MNGPLEKEVLREFTDVYDRIIRIEKDHKKTIQELQKEHVKTIQELEKKHEDNKNEIEFLKQKVEDLQKFQAPETCYQLKKQGVTRGQDIYLDSDGFNHGKKQLLMIFSSPCSFCIRFCSLKFEPA